MNQLLGPGVVLTEVLCASYVLLLHQPKKPIFLCAFYVQSQSVTSHSFYG